MDTVKHALGDVVYLKVNAECSGMVTGILFRPQGVRYFITWGNANETSHYDIELTNEKVFANETPS